ncbi:gamma-glutamylcyclotransferase (GGCT)/AIG2-like uncharacterized protein YtfP [Geothermobacter ehrlichii]|uniref:Gamma-glutamylcyclotransferase (GGCT)/AIG2-like uncharacterized protein YtfP n=1 Tax=Geothermobacter ehrlichii TaxID=213224 RepID=A0A5D3WJ45_9BACT|nr:gamma-glutamylcyclotransferase family protein [Geothermobacter ehrlichii]TYO97525.1 gamma-glutamylcyclotransferase (GGCT)/AIG2-like uncharacterized protein YtfP [Geothermobacter ehrlichii]
MTIDTLFVYGTLRRDAGHPMHRLLTELAVCLGPASWQGRLYRVADYPGAIPSVYPHERVIGEIWRLKEPERLLPLLDQYEECGPGFPEPTEYVRELHRVQGAAGRSLRAWVYVYNRPVAGLERIPSGDFLAGN